MSQPEPNARFVIEESADFVCTPAVLTGAALERSLKARALRAHLHARQELRDHQHGSPEDPELAFWKEHEHE